MMMMMSLLLFLFCDGVLGCSRRRGVWWSGTKRQVCESGVVFVVFFVVFFVSGLMMGSAKKVENKKRFFFFFFSIIRGVCVGGGRGP